MTHLCKLRRVCGIFTAGIFAVRIFDAENFRRLQFSPTEISAVGNFRRLEFSSPGIFAAGNFGHPEFSPRGNFAEDNFRCKLKKKYIFCFIYYSWVRCAVRHTGSPLPRKWTPPQKKRIKNVFQTILSKRKKIWDYISF